MGLIPVTQGGAMSKRIEFWFSIGSTYSYLSVSRLAAVQNASGVEFEWRPFSVRALMQEMNNAPFVGKPAKEAYMWRDLERRAQGYGLPISLPVEYPLEHFDLANQVAILGREEGWCEDYVRCAYTLWFTEGLAAGSHSNLERSIAAAGQSADRVIAAAGSEANLARYEAATNAARTRGIFGSPSFVVGEKELFWGDDRLEDAVAFAKL